MKFKSPIISAASGKLGGAVFSRNKGGNYIRNYVKPTNPKTALQTAVRQIRSQTSKAWAALDQEIKQAWSDFALENPVTGKLGDPIYLSGFGWYQKASFNFVNIGETLDDIAVPRTTDVPEIGIESLTCDLLTGIIVTLNEAVPSGFSCILRAKKVNSNGITSPGRLKQVKILASGAAAAINITTNCATLFGTLTVGEVMFVEAFLVDEASGYAGPVISTNKVVITDTTP